MTRHRLPLRTPEDQKRAAAWLDRVPCGKGWRLEFLPPVRSNLQSAYMWALLDDVAGQKQWAGKFRSSDDWKNLFSASLRGQELAPNLDGDGFVAFGARTSEFSPEEMSDMIEIILAWGANNGVCFTDTDTAPSGARATSTTGADGAGVARDLEGEE